MPAPLPLPLRLRGEFLSEVRRHFTTRGFVEAESALLVECGAIEPALDPFSWRGENGGGQLPTSPEFRLKRLLSLHPGNYFEIARAFRDEPESNLHRREFSMLEWYRVGVDYRALMDDCGALVAALVDWARPRFPRNPLWAKLGDGASPARLTVAEAFRRHAALALEEYLPPAAPESLVAEARRRGKLGGAPAGWDDACFAIFLDEVEPRLGQAGPLLLHDYPAGQAALARLKADDPRWAERVELYLAGVELGNGFSELTDPREQRARWRRANEARAVAGKPPHPEPAALYAALDAGLPECAGMAIGLDRLYALLCGEKSVAAVRFPPL